MIAALNFKPPSPIVMAQMAFLGGIRIVESKHCQERKQYRFPRSKKKRIRNKWSSREENFRYIPTVIQIDGELMAHPSILQRLREEVPQIS